MPRRGTFPSVLGLALVVNACAPTGEPRGEGWEPSPVGWRRRVDPGAEQPQPQPRDRGAHADDTDLGDPSCGAIAIAPVGPWQREGARLREVRGGWHPRAEYGQPVAIREARVPFEVAGHTFFQVQVDGAPRAIQPCFIKDEAPEHAFPSCVTAWQLVGQATPEARPRTNAQWAQLLGLLDGASAVYSTTAELDRCEKDLPAHVRAGVAPLGLRTNAGAIEVAFVERIAVGTELALLVTVHATLADDRLQVQHHELLTIDRGVMR